MHAAIEIIFPYLRSFNVYFLKIFEAYAPQSCRDKRALSRTIARLSLVKLFDILWQGETH
jgi:hypothetical protein